jgi:endoglucanase
MFEIKRIAVAALAALTLCGAAAATPVSDHGRLSVRGNRIVDKNGDPVQLRGMSFFWDQWSEGSKFYTSGVVSTLASDWKVSVVRAAFSGKSGNINLTKTVINAAKTAGIYAIADYHSHDAHNEVTQATAFFEDIAKTYKDDPNIIYEIYNEPADNVTWSQIKTYANAIIPKIRAIDPNGIILVGTRLMSKRVDEAAADPPSGTNLAYVAHYYAAQEGHGDEIRTMIGGALRLGKAVFVTEMGVTEADGGIDHPNIIDTVKANTWFSYLDLNQIGWANWSICDKNEGASALRAGASTGGGWSTSNYTPSGLYIYNKLRFYANSAYTLTVNVNGNGTVTRIPNYQTYNHGTPVTLIAKPASAGMEVRWSGDISGASDTMMVSMNGNKSVTAAFAQAGNLLQNGSFVAAVSPWQVYKNGLLDPAPNPELSAVNAEGRIAFGSPAVAGTAVDHAYIYQTGVALKNGRAYKLTFRARGASARSVTAKVVAGSADCMNPYEFQLTAAAQSFQTTFNMTRPDAANAALRFCFGGNTAGWFITDVRLEETGPATGIAPVAVSAANRTAWSISKSTGALQIRGPLEAGARVSLYDTRGKALRNAAAHGGGALSTAGIPAGSYFVIVRNRAGADLYRARVSL